MSSTTRSWRLDGYAQDAKVYLTGAQSLADDRGHVEVESLHLLYRLLDRDAYTQKVFEAAGIDPGDLLVECEAVLRKLPQVPGAVAFVSPRLFGTSTRAEAEAARDASPVRVRHLVAALVSEVAGLTGAVLRSLDVNEQRVREALKAVPEGPMVTTESTTAPSFGGGGGGGGGSGGGGGAAGNALAQYTRDLIAEASAERYDPIVGRDGELRRMLQVLARRQKNNPLLVGEPGVGKRSIAYALASRLAQGDVPAPLEEEAADAARSGAARGRGPKLRGELEERLRAGAPGGARRRGGHHPLRRRAAHPLWEQLGGERARPICSSPRCRGARCSSSAPPRPRSTRRTSRKTRPCRGSSRCCPSRRPPRRRRSPCAGASSSATRFITACASPTRRWWPR
jgi:hypothetical protein